MRWSPDQVPEIVGVGLCDRARKITGDREARMRGVADLLWDALHDAGMSWIGFYLVADAGNDHGAEPGESMILGPCRDKPACSPIGLHGACGQSWSRRSVLIVRDVAALGEGYIACDPRDRSELVIPCFDDDGSCWGVLDADSHEPACFDHEDAAMVRAVLLEAGLTTEAEAPVELI
jgi:putative methionine-R-sulfoxide reductase with GAF domain